MSTEKHTEMSASYEAPTQTPRTCRLWLWFGKMT